MTGDSIDWWPWSYSVITVPRVSRLGTDRLRVDRASVVHLQERLRQDLPVAAEVDLLDVDHPKRRGRQLRQEARDRIEEVQQRPGSRIEVHEVPATPGLAAHRRQAPLTLVEIDEVPLVRDLHELAGQVVAPRVELAGEPARRAALVPHHRCPPVAAGVVEPPHDAVLAPGQQDRCAGDVASLVAAGRRQLRLMGRVQPGPLEQVLAAPVRGSGDRCTDRGAGRAASGSRRAGRCGPPRTPIVPGTGPDTCRPRSRSPIVR